MAKHSKKQKGNKLIIILRLIFIITFIISLLQIIKWIKENQENKKMLNEISETVVTDKSEENEENTSKYNVNFEKLKKINQDTIAWLRVKGTNVEYPVVQTSDNSYYLNHNFEKKYNKAGWLFADYKNKFDGTDKNIVIYGHNRKDGSMFGTLKNILNSDWYENVENRQLTFIKENENCIYEVFSVYQIEEEDYYINTNFKDIQFSKFVETLKKRSIKDFGVEVNEEDNILTLSTCGESNKDRVVLHAKKIN